MTSPRNASEFILSLKDEARWKTFGIHLGITRAVIRRIEQKQCNDVDDYFAEIYYYLERSDKKLTWNAIARALEKSGNVRLAKEIRRKHGNTGKSSLNRKGKTGLTSRLSLQSTARFQQIFKSWLTGIPFYYTPLKMLSSVTMILRS